MSDAPYMVIEGAKFGTAEIVCSTSAAEEMIKLLQRAIKDKVADAEFRESLQDFSYGLYVRIKDDSRFF